MTVSANILHAITDTLLLKAFRFPSKDASANEEKLADTATTNFWSYTEKNADADLTSFKGLL